MGGWEREDILDAWHDAQDILLERRPHCDWCDQPIQENTYYEIDGLMICEHCLTDYMDDKHLCELEED